MDVTGAALITGGAQGIGRAIAERLSAEGWPVAVCDLDERAAKVASELEAAGGRAIGLAFDVADPDAAARAHADAAAALGPVTVVVANAGIVDQIARADRLSTEGWRREVDVNLSGAFFTVRPALAGLRERRGGRIIVTSSVASMIGTEGQVAYAATKAGLLGMVRTLALELASSDTTVNAVLPGFIATEKVLGMPPSVRERVLARIPLRRYGTLDEIAGLVAYLASPAAAYITGACIPIDGGFLLNGLTLGRD